MVCAADGRISGLSAPSDPNTCFASGKRERNWMRGATGGYATEGRGGAPSQTEGGRAGGGGHARRRGCCLVAPGCRSRNVIERGCGRGRAVEGVSGAAPGCRCASQGSPSPASPAPSPPTPTESCPAAQPRSPVWANRREETAPPHRNSTTAHKFVVLQHSHAHVPTRVWALSCPNKTILSRLAALGELPVTTRQVNDL